MTTGPAKLPEQIAVRAAGSAIAVHATNRRPHSFVC